MTTSNLTAGQLLDLVAERANLWIGVLNAQAQEKEDAFQAELAAKYPGAEPLTRTADSYSLDPLTKYVRVVMQNGATPPHVGQRSVHAFYDPKTGDVFKSAGWKSPAKGVRYNLADDDSFNAMMTKVDRFGGYLYAR